jgi:hypothetical protein
MTKFLISLLVVLCIIGAGAMWWELDRQAKQEGFEDFLERYAAAHAGHIDPIAYRAAKAAEERRKAEMARARRESNEAANAAKK